MGTPVPQIWNRCPRPRLCRDREVKRHQQDIARTLFDFIYSGVASQGELRVTRTHIGRTCANGRTQRHARYTMVYIEGGCGELANFYKDIQWHSETASALRARRAEVQYIR